MSSSTSSSGGIGLVTALTVTFVVLKALGKLSWSWWWVFSPIWISAAITLTVLLIVGIIMLALWIFSR